MNNAADILREADVRNADRAAAKKAQRMAQKLRGMPGPLIVVPTPAPNQKRPR